VGYRARSGQLLLVGAALALAIAILPRLPNAAATSSGTMSVHFGTWGSTSTRRDLKVNPGDDFERYRQRTWMDATEIPADKSSNSVGSEVSDRNQDRLQTIVTGSTKDSQIGALYASYMDEARLEQLDATPLKADLARVDAIKSKAEFTNFMAGTFGRLWLASLFGPGIGPDPVNPAINMLYLGTSGLGLPDRDYYLVEKYKPQLEAYRAYIQRTLQMTGDADPAAGATGFVAFETEIAKLSWPIADLRNIDKSTTRWTRGLAAYAPGIDWREYLGDAKINVNN
jgi:putative endopeptidase